MQAKKQQSEPDLEQQTASKLRKKNVKTVYCHPAYSTYMQSTSSEMLGWMKHKLGSRLLGEISITSDMQMTPPLWQKMKIIASGSITSWHIVGETMETASDYFGGLQNHCRW